MRAAVGLLFLFKANAPLAAYLQALFGVVIWCMPMPAAIAGDATSVDRRPIATDQERTAITNSEGRTAKSLPTVECAKNCKGEISDVTWKQSFRVRLKRSVPDPLNAVGPGVGLIFVTLWAFNFVFDYAFKDTPTLEEVALLKAQEDEKSRKALERWRGRQDNEATPSIR